MELYSTQYECNYCQRFFKDQVALYKHYTHTSRHAWCERCDRVFPSTVAKQAHLRDSNAHFLCLCCPQALDFESEEDLEEHLVRCHHFCLDCDICCGSKKELQEHDVQIHHLCIKCSIYFSNRNGLQMHQKKHQPRTLECHGCYQTFKTFSGMLIHFESGNCASDMTEVEVDCKARQCSHSRKYIFEDFEDGGWIYMCPSCKKHLPKLSALYQHAEDVTCCSFLTKGTGCLAELECFIAHSFQ